jgi:CheY-like chemotaxis protein/PAS domain-containing protein
VADKPSLLVIERDSRGETPGRSGLDEHYDIVVARSMAKALVLLRQRQFAGVYVDSAQLNAVQWAGVMIQADEILDAIADGVAVVDPVLKIIWANPEFVALADRKMETIGGRFYNVLGSPEILGPDPCPFTSAVASKSPASTVLRIAANRYLRVTVTPVLDLHGGPSHLIALTRDITVETLQEQKIDAIHKAGEELADLTPDELAEMSVEDRSELLKFNITKHMKGLLGLDFIEIRLLDRATLRLIPLLTEGMTATAARRELFAKREGNGVTGFVAATGQSYLCPDTANDPLYLEGAEGAKSSLTVPLLYHGTIIGTLNVENAHPNAFHDRDRQFLEIYARSVASALNTLELLQAEKLSTATASVEAIAREVALPLDDILNDATTVLDRYAGHDEDIVARLRHLLYRAREIRALIQKVGSRIAPEPSQATAQAASSLAQSRLLVVDSDESVRRSAHALMYRQGSTVETAQNAQEAIALARLTPYSAALVDIRLPDMEGYEVYKRLREVQPGLPIILMTGFGYDPTHAIVKARQDGLQTVLYKPFRVDRLMEAVEQALRQPRAEGDGAAPSHSEPGSPASNSPGIAAE